MKIEGEVKQCDCCNDLYFPGQGDCKEYELTRNGVTVDLCNRCKHNMIVYINSYINIKREEQEEKQEEKPEKKKSFFSFIKESADDN